MRRMPRIAKVPLNYDTIRSLTNAVKDKAMGREALPLLREERARACAGAHGADEARGVPLTPQGPRGGGRPHLCRHGAPPCVR